ncbi:DNA-binding protein [Maribellus luteus]|uniref:DNA-binding protein n=1 Tax=Maribellus luteus TaxID=2305463 RepID=A0A399T148_9BACT|nr:helix-turn-helix domain-containing protein [Maribellus luteus]RIJ48764.1 DNA-binding protein [Maribellus luteus]
MKNEELTVQEFVRKQKLLQKEILTPTELAEYTGFSKSYIYKLTHLREIPFYCPRGKLIFFKRSEIDSWLLQNKRLSRHEISEMGTQHLVKNH